MIMMMKKKKKRTKTRWNYSAAVLTGADGGREDNVVEGDVSERVATLDAHDLNNEFRGRGDAKVNFRPVRSLCENNVGRYRRLFLIS